MRRAGELSFEYVPAREEVKVFPKSPWLEPEDLEILELSNKLYDLWNNPKGMLDGCEITNPDEPKEDLFVLFESCNRIQNTSPIPVFRNRYTPYVYCPYWLDGPMVSPSNLDVFLRMLPESNRERWNEFVETERKLFEKLSSRDSFAWVTNGELYEVRGCWTSDGERLSPNVYADVGMWLLLILIAIAALLGVQYASGFVPPVPLLLSSGVIGAGLVGVGMWVQGGSWSRDSVVEAPAIATLGAISVKLLFTAVPNHSLSPLEWGPTAILLVLAPTILWGVHRSGRPLIFCDEPARRFCPDKTFTLSRGPSVRRNLVYVLVTAIHLLGLANALPWGDLLTR